MEKKPKQTQSAPAPMPIGQFLNNYLPYIDRQVPTLIDHGGCGRFALILATQLKKMGIKFKIWAVYGGWLPSPQYMNLLEFTKRGMAYRKRNLSELSECGAGHICVEVDGEWYDNDGVNTHSPMSSYKTTMTYDELKTMVETSAHWNDVFDKTQVPLMESLMANMAEDWKTWKEKPIPAGKQLNAYTRKKEAANWW